MYKLAVLILVFLGMSFVMGRLLFWIDNTKFINNTSRKLMDVIPWDYGEIKASVVGVFYYITPAVFMAAVSIPIGYNIFPYFLIKIEYLPYILITILGELSMITMLSGCLTLFSEKVNWQSEIGNISWIQSIQNRNPAVVPFVPLIAAFFEETFFRGTIFMILYLEFPETGPVFPIIVTAALFSFEQVLFTGNKSQGLSMILGSVGISVVACLSILYTGSILPCVLAHQFFLVFYFGKFKYY